MPATLGLVSIGGFDMVVLHQPSVPKHTPSLHLVALVNLFRSAERAAHLNYGPISILAAFAGSHLILQHRIPAIFYGVDNNVYPRDDLSPSRGEKLIASGKISLRQLARLKRWQAAHYNAVEHLPVFVAAVLSLQLAGAANRVTNKVCATYLACRAAHSALYIAVESEGLAWLRTIAWWSGNVTCIYALLHSAKLLNRSPSL